ncbi:MAG: KAP family NTPase [Deltaproteobacteria bacterium]|nr:KAP family NTPase [Deltaproteobacteria bacterium]
MRETKEFEFLADAPIASEAEDVLNFSIHAKEIANQVQKWFDKNEKDRKESFVIGIEGEWGVGKTSLINLIKKEINKYNENKNIINIIDFNPWNFSNTDALILEFFHSIDDSLGNNKQFKKLSKNYIKAILSGSNISARINIFNIISTEWQSKEIKFKDKPLQKQKEEIDKIFNDKQIIIIIDDIDRLDLLETNMIFKLIKRTANFPNTVFLLAYDRKRLSEKIDRDGYPGEEYLEKIIQLSYPLTVSIYEQNLYEGLWGNIRNIIGDDFKYVNEARFGEAVRKIIYLINIREVKQYINLIKSDWKTYISKHNNAEPINSKMNLTDFLIIRLIKTLAPEFFKSIRKNRDFFVSESKTNWQYRDSNARIFSQRSGVRVIMQEPILDICKMLFPKLIQNSKNSGPLRQEDKGIHRNNVFDLYFYINKEW